MSGAITEGYAGVARILTNAAPPVKEATVDEHEAEAFIGKLEKWLLEAGEHLAAAKEAIRAKDYGTASSEMTAVYMAAGSAGKSAYAISRPLAAEALDPGHAACSRCSPPCDRAEQCDNCTRYLPHDYVHWNGAFYQCEHCAIDEASRDLAERQAELSS